MKKTTIIFLGFLLILNSCKIFKEANQSPILIPTSVTATETKIPVDSLKLDSTLQVQTRLDFFKDSLLQKYIDIALKNNFDNRIALEKIKQQQAHLARMKGVLLPSLGINLGAGGRRFGDYTVDGVGNYDTQFSPNLTENQRIPSPIVPDYALALTTSWEIDVWRKLREQKKAVINRYLASTLGQKFLQTNLVYLTADSYYRLVVLDERIRLINENINLQENALRISEAQKSSGKSNQLAVDILKADIIGAKNDLLALEKVILEEENKFNSLLGRYPEKIERQIWTSQLSVPYTSNGVSSELLLKRPDIQTAFLELKASQSEVLVAKKAFYPNFIIQGSMGLNAFRAALFFDAPSSLAFQFLGGLSAPLLNRRELIANLLENQSKKREQFIVLEKTIVNAFTEVYQLIRFHSILESQAKLKEEQVQILNQSIETSNSLFTSGRANYLEIINAQHSYLKARMELLDLYQQQQELNIHLYRALGGGL